MLKHYFGGPWQQHPFGRHAELPWGLSCGRDLHGGQFGSSPLRDWDFDFGCEIASIGMWTFDEIWIGILAGKFGLHEMELRQRQTKRNKMRHSYFYSQCSFRDQESCHPDWSIIDLGQELSPQGPCGSLAMILMVNLHGRRSIFRDGF